MSMQREKIPGGKPTKKILRVIVRDHADKLVTVIEQQQSPGWDRRYYLSMAVRETIFKALECGHSCKIEYVKRVK
jgi:hypothetical protein